MMLLARSGVLRSIQLNQDWKFRIVSAKQKPVTPAIVHFSSSSVTRQSQRRLSDDNEEQSEAQKRLNEILDKLSQKRKDHFDPIPTKSVKQTKETRERKSAAPSPIDALYDRFASDEIEALSAYDGKKNSQSQSVLERLASEAADEMHSRSLQSSVFKRLVREKDREDRPKDRDQSLFKRLTTEQELQRQREETTHAAPGSQSNYSTREPQATSAADTTLQSALNSGPSLSIFANTPGDAVSTRDVASVRRGATRASLYSNDVLNTIERELVQRACSVLPFSAFDEQIALTRSGKLWQFPIDNELLFDEARVHFSEHVFLDRYLDRIGFPKAGPLRRYAELVCLGLSSNSHLTARQKRAHLDWLRFYFGDRLRVFDRFSRDEEELPAAAAAAAAAASQQADISRLADSTAARSLSTLLAGAERAASRSDASLRGGSDMQTDKRQRKDIIQATRTAERVLNKADAPSAATTAASKAKPDVKKK